MTTMPFGELAKVRKWVSSNNENNPHMKFFLDIREGVLLSINVRFFVMNQNIKKEIEEQIYDAITVLSHYRLFPDRDKKMEYGILRLDVSYVHKFCQAKDLIRGLEFIREDMPKFLRGK